MQIQTSPAYASPPAAVASPPSDARCAEEVTRMLTDNAVNLEWIRDAQWKREAQRAMKRLRDMAGRKGHSAMT